MSTFAPFAKPMYVMLKPVGSKCNLDCEYCYYLEKANLFPKKNNQVMSEELLERFTKQYIESQTQPQVMFTWHGGETLMRPLSFYRKAVELQKKYAGGRQIDNSIQTNGTLLNDEWCAFFKEINCRYIQFTPIVERIRKNNNSSLKLATAADEEEDVELAPFTVPAEKWGKFLCDLFDEWIKEDVGKTYIQIFDSTLANWVGEQPGVCTMAKTCGHAGAMEFNGDVYSCDHFVFPEYRLGNIYDKPLASLMYSEQQLSFGNDKYDTLPQQCRECDMLFTCYGECPKNRFIRDKYGNKGLNYLCSGYYRYYNHVAPYMDFMRQELLAGRPPANVMEWARFRQASR